MNGPHEMGKPGVFRWWMVPPALVMLLVAGVGTFRSVTGKRIEAKLDEIRAAGCPVTLEELDAWYPTPQGENAADYYEDAFRAYVECDEVESEPLPVIGRGKLPGRGERLPEETKKLVRAFLEENRDALAKLRRAADIPGCRYPIDVRKGVNTLLPELQKVREGANLLKLAAIFEAGEGRPHEAAEAIYSNVRLAESLRNEPLLVSSLVRTACLSIAADTAEQTLNLSALPGEKLDLLREAFRQAENPFGMARALTADRCFGIDLFSNFQQWAGYFSSEFGGLANSPLRVPLTAFYRVSGMRELDFLYYLDNMDEVIAVSRREVVRDRLAYTPPYRNEFPKYAVFTALLLPALDSVIEADVRGIEILRVTHAALTVERFRVKYDRLPENLSELVPEFLSEVPLDPYDGNPLRYKKLEKGYVVYSIGQDKTDDGGKEPDPEKGSWRGQTGVDYTFTVERE
ncbi:MAG: hypothetical protein V1918_09365 [Planctomycetota bacterium]